MELSVPTMSDSFLPRGAAHNMSAVAHSTSVGLLAWLWQAHPTHAARLAAHYFAIPHPLPPRVIGLSLHIADVTPLLTVFPAAMLPARIMASVRSRQIEFLAGRLCAEQCARSVLESGSIDVGERGEPIWPRGLVGSIAHSDSTVYAATCSATLRKSIGIDSERIVNDLDSDAIADVCMTVRERDRWELQGDKSLVATLIFSVKEALFKSVYPRVGRWIDFTEIEVEAINWSRGYLMLSSRAARDLSKWTDHASARFAVTGGDVHTMVCVSE